VHLRSRPHRPENRPIIRLFQAGNVCFSRIYHRLAVLSPQCLPRDGAAIIVSNHTSGLDPLLIQSVCPRLIVWMMAKEYYDQRGMSWLFRLIEAIPVARAGRDVAATRAALRVLAQGRVLGVFPEGRIERTKELLPFQTGVSLMAIKTGVAIHPVWLDGTQRNRPMLSAFLLPQKARIAFGRPIRLDRDFSSKDIDGATLALQSAVQSLGKGSPAEGLRQPIMAR
jgi:1-acyl-sn-glycerol-3-phosphate acyltransferase